VQAFVCIHIIPLVTWKQNWQKIQVFISTYCTCIIFHRIWLMKILHEILLVIIIDGVIKNMKRKIYRWFPVSVQMMRLSLWWSSTFYNTQQNNIHHANACRSVTENNMLLRKSILYCYFSAHHQYQSADRKNVDQNFID